MIPNNLVLVWLVGIIGVALFISNLATHFSSQARTRKRRRRNYGPVVSKTRKPMVRLSVLTR